MTSIYTLFVIGFWLTGFAAGVTFAAVLDRCAKRKGVLR